MTIQAFSTKTGIPKSTLRFYESKSLLQSVRSEESNYRMYSEEQVPLAKLIASLRTANIPIRDIQHYLKADKTTQKLMKQGWIQTVKENLEQMEISLRYLESDQGEEAIYMFEKGAEKIVWFQAESPPGQFSEELIFRREQLRQYKIPVHNTYLRYLSGNRKLIKADIGFGVPAEVESTLIPKATIEEMKESLCIGLAFHGNFSRIEAAYRKLVRYCMVHNWTLTGSILEWYRGDQINTADIIIPVTKTGGKTMNLRKLQVEVVELEGSAYEIGVKQGSALKKKRRVEIQSDADMKEAIERLGEVSPSFLMEIKGLAAGMGIEVNLAIQMWGGYDTSMPSMGCTTLADDSFYVRNYDFSDELYDARLVLFKPNEGYASIGFSQQIAGRLDGMNEKGLVVGLHLVNENVNRKGFLATSICRLILDQCATTEEAVSLIKQVPHQYCFNFSITDKDGNNAIVEASPDEQAVEYTSPLLCTNHFETEKLKPNNRVFIDRSLKRKSYLQALEKEDLNPISAYELFNNKHSPLFFNNYEEYFGTLHTVVYCPKNLSVIVGIGGDCEPYVLSFGEWLVDGSTLPKMLEGMIEG
jgi:predicted choloylglycine hydrolase/DNA-binding transcriptional MerR regulator